MYLPSPAIKDADQNESAKNQQADAIESNEEFDEKRGVRAWLLPLDRVDNGIDAESEYYGRKPSSENPELAGQCHAMIRDEQGLRDE
jgi:hypothetical protein